MPREPVPAPVTATSPISLTQVAADKVMEIRKDEAIEDTMFLRVHRRWWLLRFSYDLYFDTSTPMDKQLVSNGVTIIVDQMSLQYLRGTGSTQRRRSSGRRLPKFHNPNVKSTCGCGSSFSV